MLFFSKYRCVLGYFFILPLSIHDPSSRRRYHPSFKGIEGHGWREGRKAAFGSTFKLWFAACFLLAGLLCVGDRDAKRAREEEEENAQLLGGKRVDNRNKRDEGKNERGKDMDATSPSPQPKGEAVGTTGKAQSVLEQLQQEQEQRLLQQKRQHHHQQQQQQQQEEEEEGGGGNRRNNTRLEHGVAYFVPWRNTPQPSAPSAVGTSAKASPSSSHAVVGPNQSSSSPPMHDRTDQQQRQMTVQAREQLHLHFQNQKAARAQHTPVSAPATSPSKNESAPFRAQLRTSPPPTRSNRASKGGEQPGSSERGSRVDNHSTNSNTANAKSGHRSRSPDETSYIGRIVARSFEEGPQKS